MNTGGDTRFMAPVDIGSLTTDDVATFSPGSLTTVDSGTTFIQGGRVDTHVTGKQTYHDKVVIVGDTTLNAHGDVTFFKTLTGGASALFINNSTVTSFRDAVTLKSLETDQVPLNGAPSSARQRSTAAPSPLPATSITETTSPSSPQVLP